MPKILRLLLKYKNMKPNILDIINANRIENVIFIVTWYCLLDQPSNGPCHLGKKKEKVAITGSAAKI